jgi:hypothetical protein
MLVWNRKGLGVASMEGMGEISRCRSMFSGSLVRVVGSLEEVSFGGELDALTGKECLFVYGWEGEDTCIAFFPISLID